MTELGSFLNRNCEIASLHQEEDKIVLFPAGLIEVFGDDNIVMDRTSAEVVIDGFNERGIKIPVDWEHSTHFKASQGEESPAAGWITAMEWSETDGLLATVEWGEKARAQIKAKEYKFLSPHFRLNKDTQRVEHVIAVALTNTPRINNMRELRAASVAAAGDVGNSDGGNTMLKKTRVRLCSTLKLGEEATDEEIIAAMDEVVRDPEANADETTVDPDLAAAAQSMMMQMKQLLVDAGVVGIDEPMQGVFDAIMGIIGRTAEEAPAAVEEAAASIASALGMPKGKKHTTKEIVASIMTQIASTVPAGEVKDLIEKVASLTSEKEEREANEIVGKLVSDNKLNQHDPKKMDWARGQARTNREAFCSLMEEAPAIYGGDRETSDGKANATKRDTVICSALADYDGEVLKSSKPRFYVNAALNAEGMDGLTDADRDKHKIA